METKKFETKNQHYVPQFYLRAFSEDEEHKTVGTYVLDKEFCVSNAPIKNQASGDYYYSDNPKIEKSLKVIEDAASIVIKGIIQNPKITIFQNDELALYVFTMVQIGRTMERAQHLEDMMNQLLKQIAKIHIRTLRNSENHAQVDGLTDDDIDNVEFNLNEPGAFTLGIYASLIQYCSDLAFKVIINNSSASLITSDNPACLYSLFHERMGIMTYALNSKGLIIYLPLSPKTAIVFYDSSCYKIGDRKKQYVELSKREDADNLNKLIACHANKTLYFTSSNTIESDLHFLVEHHKRYKQENRTYTIEKDVSENRKILGTVEASVFCNLKLSFISELPKSKAITKSNFNSDTDLFRI